MGEKRQTEHTQANAVTVEPKSSSQRSQQKVRHDIEMICAWVSFAALVVCNVLAQTGVMRRMVKPQHSEAFTWFVPARYTDLIWAVIFVFAAVWLVRLGNDKHRARNLGQDPGQSPRNLVHCRLRTANRVAVLLPCRELPGHDHLGVCLDHSDLGAMVLLPET